LPAILAVITVEGLIGKAGAKMPYLQP
jgi:hypothetical protein